MGGLGPQAEAERDLVTRSKRIEVKNGLLGRQDELFQPAALKYSFPKHGLHGLPGDPLHFSIGPGDSGTPRATGGSYCLAAAAPSRCAKPFMPNSEIREHRSVLNPLD